MVFLLQQPQRTNTEKTNSTCGVYSSNLETSTLPCQALFLPLPPVTQDLWPHSGVLCFCSSPSSWTQSLQCKYGRETLWPFFHDSLNSPASLPFQSTWVRYLLSFLPKLMFSSFRWWLSISFCHSLLRHYFQLSCHPSSSRDKFQLTQVQGRVWCFRCPVLYSDSFSSLMYTLLLLVSFSCLFLLFFCSHSKLIQFTVTKISLFFCMCLGVKPYFFPFLGFTRLHFESKYRTLHGTLRRA